MKDESSRTFILHPSSFILVFLLIFATPATTPPVPYYDRDVCPLECCKYQQWTAIRPLQAYASSQKSRKTFRIAKGERVRALTGDVKTVEPGVIKQGEETIYILHEGGEGEATIWHRGEVGQFDMTAEDGTWKLVKPVKSEWWVKVRNRAGKTGWVDNSKIEFDGTGDCR